MERAINLLQTALLSVIDHNDENEQLAVVLIVLHGSKNMLKLMK